MYVNVQEEDQALFVGIPAPESRHSMGSMDTLNLDLSDFSVANQDWQKLSNNFILSRQLLVFLLHIQEAIW